MRDIFIQGLSTVIALRVIADKFPNSVTSAVLHPGIHFYISHLITLSELLAVDFAFYLDESRF